MQKRKGKKRFVEIGIVLLVLAGAITYQAMHETAAENNIVHQPVPSLGKQQLKSDDGEKEVVGPVPVPKPSLQEKVNAFIAGLSAPGLRVYNPHLSTLGEAPEWAALDKYQKTISRTEFLRLLTTVYTVGDEWKEWITLEDDHALIVQSAGQEGQEKYKLEFAEEDVRIPARYWRSAKQMGPAPAGKPLAGMLIAIDAGHLGGEQWAKIEAREFKVGNHALVREGVLTLKVANILKPKLEALGAEVVLVRSNLEPLNPKRPGHYEYDARIELEGKGLIPSLPAIELMKNRMFYRVGEIRKRSEIVNGLIKPDLTLCLHFNAEGWGDPENPTMVDKHHLHLILHGAFTAGELALDDERFSMLHKILMKNHDEEAGVSEAVAAEMVKASGLPAFEYEPDSFRARNVRGNPYLWARNLLANRLYDCPVVYLEPYVMNDNRDYSRIQMGDYEGELDIDGVKRKSIFREYADGVVEGLKFYYTNHRGVVKPEVSDSEEEENE